MPLVRNLDIVKKLLKAPTIDINCTDNRNFTPLHLSCYEGHLDVTELLLERGADVDAVDDNGRTPLFYAMMNYPEISSMLIKYGCDVNAIDECGYAPLHWAVESNDIDAVRELLESETIDVNLTDEKSGKNTALHLAVQNPDCKEEIVQCLVYKGANLNALNENNKTPWNFADFIFTGSDANSAFYQY